MSEKRLTFNKLFKILETYDIMKFLNALHAENIDSHIRNDFLKDENEQLKQENKENNDYFKKCHVLANKLSKQNRQMMKLQMDFLDLKKENEQLKEEIAKFREWEKYIGDVKREDLDIIFNLSVYEIAGAFEYYKKRIKELEDD